MRCVMRFPGGRAKALTLSYDDGNHADKTLIGILDRYGIKCTLNLNSGLSGTDDWRMTLPELADLAEKGGHEIACHGLTHPFLQAMPPSAVMAEIFQDRINLENATGKIVRGMAYPYGTFSDSVAETLKNCGIVYSRTVNSTEGFEIPSDWLRLNPTCHHDNPRLSELANNFLGADITNRPPWLFYLWGHSFEFDRNQNWNVLEEFCEAVGGRNEIWYATNIEIYDYVAAYNSLISSADGSKIYNPTATAVYVECNQKITEIKPGETVTL